MKNSIFARFARAFFIFWHFVDVFVLYTTWNDLFSSCVDDVSAWEQVFNFVFLCAKRRFQLNSRIVRTHFSSIMSLNNWKMIAETRSCIFRWRSRFRRRHVCLSSLRFHNIASFPFLYFFSPCCFVIIFSSKVFWIWPINPFRGPLNGPPFSLRFICNWSCLKFCVSSF